METKLIDKKLKKEYWKKRITMAIRILVSGSILYFLISLVQWENVLAAYRVADGRYIAAGAVLVIGNLGVRTLKWKAMLMTVKKSPTLWESFGSVMLGISLGSFTPGEIGEFAGRTLHIANARRSHLVGLTLLDKTQISIVIGSAGIISIVVLVLNDFILVSCIIILIIILSFIIFYQLDRIAKLGYYLNASLFKRAWISRVLDGFCLLRTQHLTITLMYTITFLGVLVLQMFFLINAFAQITFLQAFIGTSSMMFVKSLLPISLADLGIREASTIFFFAYFNIPQAAALNAALLLFFINVFVPGVIGTLFLKHQLLMSLSISHILKKKNDSPIQ